MLNYTLGTIEATEALIKDLYLDLRAKVNAWSEITQQTPQARMGYIGQHLVSVVTGYPGGKSGARGYDLIIDENSYGEIKTCYRVDQLGACGNCANVVSSLERQCSRCGSTQIIRRDDSKWLINIRNDDEFKKVIEPEKYYFVLFEFEELNNETNNTIIASIWEVNPKNKGFAYCMIDYYLNIRANSNSKAPFNMWPHEFKFALTKPTLIYQSRIHDNGTIETLIFPTRNNILQDTLRPLTEYSRATTITVESIKRTISTLSPETNTARLTTKQQCLQTLETLRTEKNISNGTLCDKLAEAIYLPLIASKKEQIPQEIKQHYYDL